MKIENNPQVIQTCTKEKDLGVLFDDKLSFNQHIYRNSCKQSEYDGRITCNQEKI